MTSAEQFEPEIVAFSCHYCAYAAADLAGVMRLQYPTNIKIVKLPCSGTVDILYILKAFEQGADGVFVAGCLKGGCHFVEGNLRAEKRVARAKNLLEKIGLGKDRLEMFFMSSAEGGRFSEVAREMTERIKKLGPSPIKGGVT
jgi:F420-non-reducing hydrogenase iron-sulfur subunit